MMRSCLHVGMSELSHQTLAGALFIMQCAIPHRCRSIAAELVWTMIRMETVFMDIESEEYLDIKRAAFERMAADNENKVGGSGQSFQVDVPSHLVQIITTISALVSLDKAISCHANVRPMRFVFVFVFAQLSCGCRNSIIHRSFIGRRAPW